jgi:hypothetical protein
MTREYRFIFSVQYPVDYRSAVHVAFLAFLFNIVMSVGVNGALGIFMPSSLKTKELILAEKG